MEASALSHAGKPGLLIRSPALLRLYGDERLISAIRGGNPRAFEILFERYRAKLLAFCRGIVGSSEDGEDVLQEVFVAAHTAMLADSRPINVKPWLYRIARNRCLNHLRRPVADGADTMDTLPHANGASCADAAAGREEIRAIFADVAELPETQRTALVLREIDDLAYEEIATAMDTTLPAVKSLLVRARMALAEASESRVLTCGEVRLELAEAAEGLRKASGAVRHHVRKCDRCRRYRGELRSSSHELRALAPFAPFAFLATIRHAIGAKLGGSGGAAAGSGGAGATGAGAGGSGGLAGGLGAGGAGLGAAGTSSSAGALIGGGALGAVGAKAAGGLATAAILTAGAVGVSHYSTPTTSTNRPASVAVAHSAPPRPVPHSANRPVYRPVTAPNVPAKAPAPAPAPVTSTPPADPVPADATAATTSDPAASDAATDPAAVDAYGEPTDSGASGTESSGEGTTPDPTASGSSDGGDTDAGDGGTTDPPPYTGPPTTTPPPPPPPPGPPPVADPPPPPPAPPPAG